MKFLICKRPLLAAAAVILAVCVSSVHGAAGVKSRSERVRNVRARMNAFVTVLSVDPQKAINGLKRIMNEFPGEKMLVLDRLGYAYTAAGKVDSAIAVYEECLRFDPINLEAAKRLAGLYLNHGTREDAERIFKNMLKRSPVKLSSYKAVAEAKSGAGFYTGALSTYKEARKATGDKRIFALEIAHLELALGGWKAALEECIAYAKRMRLNARQAEKKIIDIARDPKADRTAVYEIIEKEVLDEDNASNNVFLDIISAVYFEEGLMEKALDAALRADRVPGSSGRQLYGLLGDLCEDCQKKSRRARPECLDRCIRAADGYLLAHPRSVESSNAHLVLANLLSEAASCGADSSAGRGRRNMLAEAVNEYEFVLQNFAGTTSAGRALLRLGDLYFTKIKDHRKALDTYIRGARKAGKLRLEFAERTAKALIALGRNNEVNKHCSTLIRSVDKSMRDAGYYYMGVSLAFSGREGAAKDTLTSLAEMNPASKYTNDAIDLAWIIEEGSRKDPEMMRKYLAAIKAEVSGDSAGALDLLSEFAAGPPGTPLRPRALYRLGLLYAGGGDYDGALASFDDFLEDYPLHALAPEAERSKALIYEMELDEKERALNAYEHVLMTYPEYIFMDEVRSDASRLRTELKGGRQ